MWVFVEEKWHQSQGQPTTDGNSYTAHTTCGLEGVWDGLVLDVAPASGAHEGCPAPKSDEEMAAEAEAAEEKAAAREERAAAKSK